MIGSIKPKPDRYAFTNSCQIGSPASEDSRCVQLDVWHRVIDLETGKENGYVQRLKMRRLVEVFADLERRLDLVMCEKCGWHRKRKDHSDYDAKCMKCKADCFWYIDEYFNGPDSTTALVPHNYRWIACYPVTGGNEGHYIHVDFMVPVQEIVAHEGDFGEKKFDVDVSRAGVWKPVRLALGKTFRGMGHAAEIARRCAVLLGA